MNVCKCSHPEDEHWDAASGISECMHRACGCLEYRADSAAAAKGAATGGGAA